MRHLLTACTLLLMPAVATAQGERAAATKLPDARTLGWQFRADNASADASKLIFVEMKPGWHITTGSLSGVMFHPGKTGTGNYSAKLSAYFFPPRSTHAEGWGLLLGGKDLAGANQSYTYFLVRNDGKYMVKQRTGATLTDVIPWTATDALILWKEGGPNALNVLSVDAGADNVVFKVNDKVVATRPRKELQVDGVVGMRVNHFLDLHVNDLTITASK